MLSAQRAAGVEGEVLAKLAKACRRLLADTAVASITLDGRSYYHLTTLTLLELAAATREAEAFLGAA